MLLPAAFGSQLLHGLLLVLPLMLLTIVVAILASGATGGVLFSFKSILPDFSKLNPISGMKKIVGVNAAVELLKAILKMVLIGTVLVNLLSNHFAELMALGSMALEPALAKAGSLISESVMWLTLCRPSEAVEARWAEFDLDAALWRISAERMKQRKAHAVPLPRQAVDLLRALQGITGRGEHVFPGRDDRSKPMAIASFRQALHVLGWSGQYSPHATRTTGSTRLNEMGYRPDWIERQLAHVEPNSVRRTYNHAEHLADRAAMMQRWADLLDEWEKAAKEGREAAAG
jgi:hypothetical protein